MDWIIRSPQIYSAFASLGYVHVDGYHQHENCNEALESILYNLLTEDKYLRSYRRNINFGQNMKNDLLPLFMHAREDKTIQLLINIFVNLTIPVECLLSPGVICKAEFRHTIFDLNNLLMSTKLAFTENRTTKVLVEFLKKNLEIEHRGKLSQEQRGNISNGLLLLRNILHIPDDEIAPSLNQTSTGTTVQNQILWNVFSQGIDKVLIKLMVIPEANFWGVTMVQLIALIYKDQHVVTLHKLLNLWLEASLSESSEDNESNTSPPDRGSEDSSLMLTSDPTYDSSDTGGSGKSNDERNCESWSGSNFKKSNVINQPDTFGKVSNVFTDTDIIMKNVSESEGTKDTTQNITEDNDKKKKLVKKPSLSDNSDCGYATQLENQDLISTSSIFDEEQQEKVIYKKPQTTKPRVCNKPTSSSTTLQERRRKKIVKRSKTNILNVQGLCFKTPTDEDIANILKEFTVDFLLKGYNSLVQTLHNQILTNISLEIDTSHFFWLLTYFLKFATQIELDFEHVVHILSFDIISYLTAEGVFLCEKFELAIKINGNDLKPSIRRLHLVVTAIREFVQSINLCNKFTHLGNDDKETLYNLQLKMCEIEELKSLMVLLLRHYDPKYHSKQYLQDLIVTNHILLSFLDNAMRLPGYKGSASMTEHIRQFAAPKMMHQYGLLLEDYKGNGEFVNDCVFTIMHHVGGELDSLVSLFQPIILKTFTAIWKSDFEICDDWTDLIEHVINTFIKKQHAMHAWTTLPIVMESDEVNPAIKALAEAVESSETTSKQYPSEETCKSQSKWTEDELSSLNWSFVQCNASSDVVGGIVKMFKDEGVDKSRLSVLKELFNQNIIEKDDFERLLRLENKSPNDNQEKDSRDSDISKLCKLLKQDGKSKLLDWVQNVLLETCYVKLQLIKKANLAPTSMKQVKLLSVHLSTEMRNDVPVMSPVSYHCLLLNQSVPLVPWNYEQAAICKDLKFLQLLHKLGLNMPVDSGRGFIRIPGYWSAALLYKAATKIGTVDESKLKFSRSEITGNVNEEEDNKAFANDDLIASQDPTTSPIARSYRVQKLKHIPVMVNYTPTPGSFAFEGHNQQSFVTGNQNWLELVQSSQHCELSLDSGRVEAKFEEEIVLKRVIQPEDPDIYKIPLPMESLINVNSQGNVILPEAVETDRLLVQNQDFNTTLPESDDNSMCETASVTSDLTRMCVSDGDEDGKSDIISLVARSICQTRQGCTEHRLPCSNDTCQPSSQS